MAALPIASPHVAAVETFLGKAKAAIVELDAHYDREVRGKDESSPSTLNVLGQARRLWKHLSETHRELKEGMAAACDRARDELRRHALAGVNAWARELKDAEEVGRHEWRATDLYRLYRPLLRVGALVDAATLGSFKRDKRKEKLGWLVSMTPTQVAIALEMARFVCDTHRRCGLNGGEAAAEESEARGAEVAHADAHLSALNIDIFEVVDALKRGIASDGPPYKLRELWCLVVEPMQWHLFGMTAGVTRLGPWLRPPFHKSGLFSTPRSEAALAQWQASMLTSSRLRRACRRRARALVLRAFVAGVARWVADGRHPAEDEPTPGAAGAAKDEAAGDDSDSGAETESDEDEDNDRATALAARRPAVAGDSSDSGIETDDDDDDDDDDDQLCDGNEAATDADAADTANAGDSPPSAGGAAAPVCAEPAGAAAAADAGGAEEEKEGTPRLVPVLVSRKDLPGYARAMARDRVFCERIASAVVAASGGILPVRLELRPLSDVGESSSVLEELTKDHANAPFGIAHAQLTFGHVRLSYGQDGLSAFMAESSFFDISSVGDTVDAMSTFSTLVARPEVGDLTAPQVAAALAELCATMAKPGVADTGAWSCLAGVLISEEYVHVEHLSAELLPITPEGTAAHELLAHADDVANDGSCKERAALEEWIHFWSFREYEASCGNCQECACDYLNKVDRSDYTDNVATALRDMWQAFVADERRRGSRPRAPTAVAADVGSNTEPLGSRASRGSVSTGAFSASSISGDSGGTGSSAEAEQRRREAEESRRNWLAALASSRVGSMAAATEPAKAGERPRCLRRRLRDLAFNYAAARLQAPKAVEVAGSAELRRLFDNVAELDHLAGKEHREYRAAHPKNL